jgi:integrase
VTPHKLRDTFASVLVAIGEEPARVTAQLGHADARFTLRRNAHAMRRTPEERERLRDLLVGGRPARSPVDDRERRSLEHG